MSDKALWYPCHIYMARSLKNKKDILIFEKAFASVMVKYGRTHADVLAGLSLIPAKLSVKSPISGQTFDQYGSLNLGSFIDSILMDSTIPSFPTCRDYYKSVFSKCEACALCEHFDGYKNLHQNSEDLLIRFLYSNERNYTYLINCGLEPKDFRSMYNLFGVMQTERPLVFDLNKFLVRTIIEAGKNRSSLFLDAEDVESSRSDYIGKKLIRALRSRSLPSDLSRGWELKYGAVLVGMISKRMCVSRDEAELLLHEIKTASCEPGRTKKRHAAVKDAGKPVGMSDLMFEVKDESVFNSIKATPVVMPVPKEDLKEDPDDGGILARAYENAVEDEGLEDDNSAYEEHDNLEYVDESALSSFTEEDTFGEDYSALVTTSAITGAKDDYTSPASNESDDVCDNASELQHDNKSDESANREHVKVIPSGLVPISEVMDENGIPLSSFHAPQEKVIGGEVVDVSDYDAISVPSRTLSTLGAFVYPEDAPADLIPRYYVDTDEMRSIIDLDKKNITLLTRLESEILNAKHICCEVCCNSSNNTSFLLIYEPYSMLYYKTMLQDQMALAVLLPIFSRQNITVVCFAAYELCSFVRRRGGVVRDLFPIQDAYAVMYQSDRYDFYAVMEDMNIAPLYSPRQNGRFRSLIFGFITGYPKLYRSLRRAVYKLNDTQIEFEMRRSVSEVLGYSYLTLTGQPLFSHTSIYRYTFKTDLQLRRMEGYRLHYEIISEQIDVDSEYIYEQVLSHLADKGYIRAHETYVVYMSKNFLDLHCEYPVFDDLTSLIDSAFLSLRKECSLPYMQLSLSYYRIHGMQSA